MASPSHPLRLFVDSGVIIDGCFGRWGASKAVLVLATMRANYTVVLAEAIEREVQRVVARKLAALSTEEARDAAASVVGWLNRVRIERHPMPTAAELTQHQSLVLPMLKHTNDLPGFVTAIKAQPDWVISANPEHWSPALGTRIGLRVVTPLEFLRQLRPTAEN